MTFTAYQGLNVLTLSIVMLGNRFILLIKKFRVRLNPPQCTRSKVKYTNPASVCYLQLALFTIMVTVAASVSTHNDSKFVFRAWINNTGWENNVIFFIIGLVNPLYSLGGLDGITV